ncbi:MAG: hypothetical protein ABIP81_02875 [Terriglobales bacterium]
MDIRALLMIDGDDALPLAQLDVLGASVAQRTTDALLAAGVNSVSVVSAYPSAEVSQGAAPVRYVKSSPEEVWRDARKAYDALAEGGADTVLLIRLNSYCEIDWQKFLGRHHAGVERLTRALKSTPEPLDIYAVDPKFQRDTKFLFHARLTHPRMPAGNYQVGEAEYAHPLRSARDLRQLAEDGLNLRSAMRPVGREVRPGVWMAEGSRVDAGVRLVAPLYLGRRVRVRTGCVVTRGSTLEHHSSVDCGTVIEHTTVLPFATVGAGLDLSQTIVGGRQVFDLKRDVAVEIHDRTLVDEAAHNAGWRLVTKAAALAAYLPLQFWRGVSQRSHIPTLATDGACVGDFAKIVDTEKQPAARVLRPGLVMERYGNQ